MNLIIDGHNLISKIPGLSLSMPDDEERLIQLLIRFSLTGKHRVEVYFDRAPTGMAGDQVFGRVHAHFVHHTQSADQAIRNRLHSLKKTSKNWVVVTSDRQVQTAARETQAGVITAEVFAGQMQASLQQGSAARQGDEKPLTEAEVREWMIIFTSPRKKK